MPRFKSVTTTTLLMAALLAVLAGPARAGQAPPDGGGGGGGGDRNHVTKLKPWQARFEYQAKDQGPAHDELNGRADVTAQLVTGGWYAIDCQLTATTQGGQVLWDHIAGAGWVADGSLRTYTDGPLTNAPSCPNPAPDHVWFEQPWAPQRQYRVNAATQVVDTPGGVSVGKDYAAGSWQTTSCVTAGPGGKWLATTFDGGSGYIPAGAVRFWQKGLPAGLPACTGPQPAPPTRTYVAMGDSYASGQGAEDYLDEPCRRSGNSYWSLLRGSLRQGLTSDTPQFVACTGAKTGDVAANQLGALSSDVRLVTLSVGGDDLGLAPMLRSCVEPGGQGCQDAIDEHITPKSLQKLQGSLDALYAQIRTRAPNARVLIMGYPYIVHGHVNRCGALDDGNLDDVKRATKSVNRTLRAAMGKRRGFTFVGLEQTFLEHPACGDGVDWINGVERDVNESFHPNELGTAAIAQRLRDVAPAYFG